MTVMTKRMKKARESLGHKKSFPLAEAIALIVSQPKVKFDETVEVHVHLNIDPKQSDQLVRGSVILPHGIGKKVKVAVFAKGAAALKAKELGVEIVGAEDLIDRVQKGFLDFDKVVATPDIMRELSKCGKILGPRGLMPSPKTGTVTVDIEKAIQEVKAGKIEFKADKQAGIHAGIGKRSFTVDQLVENANHLLQAILQVKPAAVKGEFIKSVAVATTMGVGMKVIL